MYKKEKAADSKTLKEKFEEYETKKDNEKKLVDNYASKKSVENIEKMLAECPLGEEGFNNKSNLGKYNILMPALTAWENATKKLDRGCVAGVVAALKTIKEKHANDSGVSTNMLNEIEKLYSNYPFYVPVYGDN